MKVKIKKKDSKTKTYKIIDKWEDVTLENWSKIIGLENGSKSKEAEETIAALSDIPKKLINQLSIRDVSVIMKKISELQAEPDSKLNRIIEIEGVEYGWMPNMDEITLGEFADIETMIKNGVEKHLPELMAVLYRPIISKSKTKNVYTIEAYDGNITMRAEEMKKMSAEEVQSALRFFFVFVKELLMILPSFLMDQIQATLKASQMEILPKSGDGMG